VGSVTEVVDVLVDNVVLVVDEFTTGISVLALEMLLDDEALGIVEMTLVFELTLVLVTRVEEFLVIGTVLEIKTELEIELVTMADDETTGAEILALD
jgi:hypothetical protein